MFEVVVISDGSTDATVRTLQSLDLPYELRVLEQANAGPAAARNRGVLEARGDLIVFLDDDVIPAPDFIEEHLRSHEPSDGAVVIGPLHPAVDAIEPWIDWETEILEKQYRAVESGEWETTPRQFFTGNASVARRHVIAAGMFDAAFRRSEDVELGFRLQKRGLRFVFHRAASGTHIAHRSYESWLRTAYQYGRNDITIAYGKQRRDLIESIASEFHERNALTQRLVRGALSWGARRRAAFSSLARIAITLASRLRRRRLSLRLCSGVYNLFYWYGIADELGDASAARALIASDPSAAWGILGHAVGSRRELPACDGRLPVAVIVCTKDRADQLATAIESILPSLTGDAELIIVNQGEEAPVRALVESLSRPDVSFVRCRRKGLSAARNEGAARASNELLLFTDDDCVVDPGWVASWRKAFSGEPAPGVGFGTVARADHDPRQGFIPGFDLKPGIYGKDLFTRGIGAVGMGANMAVRKQVWEALGGFDESLGAGKALAAAEDTDLAFRAVHAGYPVVHTAAAHVVHHGFRARSDASRLVAGYMGGIAAMYLKHVRCGDAFAVRLYLQEAISLVCTVVTRVASRQRPLGARSLASYLRVGIVSLRLPIDTRLRVFASPRLRTNP